MLLDAEDSPGPVPASEDTARLISMGDDAVQGGVEIRQRLPDHESWDRARVMLSMIEIAALGELGRESELRAAEHAFIDKFVGRDDWRINELVRYYERDLARR